MVVLGERIRCCRGVDEISGKSEGARVAVDRENLANALRAEARWRARVRRARHRDVAHESAVRTIEALGLQVMLKLPGKNNTLSIVPRFFV